jgi:hypothetical protein
VSWRARNARLGFGMALFPDLTVMSARRDNGVEARHNRFDRRS